jgi:hypothetical protein
MVRPCSCVMYASCLGDLTIGHPLRRRASAIFFQNCSILGCPALSPRRVFLPLKYLPLEGPLFEERLFYRHTREREGWCQLCLVPRHFGPLFGSFIARMRESSDGDFCTCKALLLRLTQQFNFDCSVSCTRLSRASAAPSRIFPHDPKRFVAFFRGRSNPALTLHRRWLDDPTPSKFSRAGHRSLCGGEN